MTGPVARDEGLMALCRACGLCCDGTLFTVVEVGEDEARAREVLRPQRRDDGALIARQPCAQLTPAGCQLYADRPRTCRAYDCLLYRAQAEGEVSLEGALPVVEKVRALLAEVDRLEGGPGALHRVRRGPPLPSGDLRDAVEAVERALRFHFLGQKR